MTAPDARLPWRGLLLIWLAALALNLLGLARGPLRDWDESLVARVALELSNTPWPDWLLPTQWGEPYLNKPPGVHALIAGLIGLWRRLSGAGSTALPPEWLVRLAPAFGSSLLSPLLGLVQWQLRPGQRRDALWTAVISLSLLPLARHGHLAMLDGLQLSAMATLWLGLLLAHPPGAGRPAAGGLLAGLAGSALLLLKAPVAPPVLLVGLALRWLDRDLDRRSWTWLLAGLALGLLPGLAWHGWHLAWRGDGALVMWGRQGLARLSSSVEQHSGGPLPPLIQVLTGGWPWLPLWPLAIVRCWQQRRRMWGRWCVGLTAMASLMVLPLQTQLPWYSLLLWPPFALCCGPLLPALIDSDSRGRWRRALIALVSGWLLALALLFQSPLWNWELNEQASILPVLPLLPQPGSGSAELPLAITGPIAKRPSLWWYAQSKPRGEGWISREAHPALLVITDRPEFQADRPFRLTSGRRSVQLQCQLDQTGQDGWNRWFCSASDRRRSPADKPG
jgi:4-amino-4-deoxy-L-arabinose transferase-like glycosyltransferase